MAFLPRKEISVIIPTLTQQSAAEEELRALRGEHTLQAQWQEELNHSRKVNKTFWIHWGSNAARASKVPAQPGESLWKSEPEKIKIPSSL